MHTCLAIIIIIIISRYILLLLFFRMLIHTGWRIVVIKQMILHAYSLPWACTHNVCSAKVCHQCEIPSIPLNAARMKASLVIV